LFLPFLPESSFPFFLQKLLNAVFRSMTGGTSMRLAWLNCVGERSTWRCTGRPTTSCMSGCARTPASLDEGSRPATLQVGHWHNPHPCPSQLLRCGGLRRSVWCYNRQHSHSHSVFCLFLQFFFHFVSSRLQLYVQSSQKSKSNDNFYLVHISIPRMLTALQCYKRQKKGKQKTQLKVLVSSL
jgi:hypothetical protein